MSKSCSRCLLPSIPPDLSVGDDGLCGACRVPVGVVGPDSRSMVEADVRELLRRHPGRGAYDCIVFCNGGRSSAVALWQAAHQLELRVLAVTLDHGLLRPGAVDGVRQLVVSLGVDWAMHSFSGMRAVFAEALKATRPVPVCALCGAWSRHLLQILAGRHQVGTVFLPAGPGAMLAGGFRLSASSQGASLARWRDDVAAFVAQHAAGQPVLEGVGAPPTRFRLPWRHRVHLGPLLLPSIPSDDELTALGWCPQPPSWPLGWDADCALATLATQAAVTDYGLSHYHLNLAHYVRIGALPWQSMQAALEPDPIASAPASELATVMDRLSVADAELRFRRRPGRGS